MTDQLKAPDTVWEKPANEVTDSKDRPSHGGYPDQPPVDVLAEPRGWGEIASGLRQALLDDPGKHTPLGYNECSTCRIMWALSYPVTAVISEVKREHIMGPHWPGHAPVPPDPASYTVRYTIEEIQKMRVEGRLSFTLAHPDTRHDCEDWAMEGIGCAKCQEAAQSIHKASRLIGDQGAMEALRFASLKRGWKWQWDGIDLRQITTLPEDTGVYGDPADAIRNPVTLPENQEKTDATT